MSFWVRGGAALAAASGIEFDLAHALAPELATHLIRFLTEPTSRTYTITDPAGRELCRSYVAGEPQRFRRLMTQQVRVGDLIEARRSP